MDSIARRSPGTSRRPRCSSAARRERVIDADALLCSEPAQVASAFLGSGNCLGVRNAFAQPEAFVVYEEERLVLAVEKLGNDNRSAEIEAKLILGESAAGGAISIVEKGVGIKVAITEELPGFAMQFV